MEKHTVKHGALRVTWAIDPAHGRDSDSKNVPGRRGVYFPLLAGKIDLRLEQEVVDVSDSEIIADVMAFLVSNNSSLLIHCIL